MANDTIKIVNIMCRRKVGGCLLLNTTFSITWGHQEIVDWWNLLINCRTKHDDVIRTNQ